MAWLLLRTHALHAEAAAIRQRRAKNSDGREALGMAIGQLYDYRRFHEPPVCLAILLPHRPNRDALTCCKARVSKRYGPAERDSATRLIEWRIRLTGDTANSP